MIITSETKFSQVQFAATYVGVRSSKVAAPTAYPVVVTVRFLLKASLTIVAVVLDPEAFLMVWSLYVVGLITVFVVAQKSASVAYNKHSISHITIDSIRVSPSSLSILDSPMK